MSSTATTSEVDVLTYIKNAIHYASEAQKQLPKDRYLEKAIKKLEKCAKKVEKLNEPSSSSSSTPQTPAKKTRSRKDQHQKKDENSDKPIRKCRSSSTSHRRKISEVQKAIKNHKEYFECPECCKVISEYQIRERYAEMPKGLHQCREPHREALRTQKRSKSQEATPRPEAALDGPLSEFQQKIVEQTLQSMARMKEARAKNQRVTLGQTVSQTGRRILDRLTKGRQNTN